MLELQGFSYHTSSIRTSVLHFELRQAVTFNSFTDLFLLCIRLIIYIPLIVVCISSLVCNNHSLMILPHIHIHFLAHTHTHTPTPSLQ